MICARGALSERCRWHACALNCSRRRPAYHGADHDTGTPSGSSAREASSADGPTHDT